MPYEKKDGDGALWMKTTARGEMMTGDIFINGETIKIVAFPNESDNPKAPRWRISKAKPRDDMARPPAGTFNSNEDVPF
jgi:hypothetical protein